MPPSRASMGSKSDIKGRSLLMKEKGVKATPNRGSLDPNDRKYDTVGRKRRIEPFKSVP